MPAKKSNLPFDRSAVERKLKKMHGAAPPGKKKRDMVKGNSKGWAGLKHS